MVFRRAFYLSGALTLAALVALVTVAAVPSYAQEMGGGMPEMSVPDITRKGPPPVPNGAKLNRDETAQFRQLYDVVDGVAAGKPAPADAQLTLHPYFFKSGEQVYVPFILDLEPGKLTSTPLVVYIRAVDKNPAEGAKPGVFAFDDVAVVTPADNNIQRALQLAPGDYSLYIAVVEKPSRDRKAGPPKTTVLNETLTVPNLSTGLLTSSILFAKTLEPAEKALSGRDQLAQPFTISGLKIAPATSTAFPKSSELLWAFYIYNEGAAAGGKPDLVVDYNFFRANEEKAFANLPPSPYNASANLAPEFDLAAGHQVFVGQGVPLASFAAGDYKLEFKVTDKTNGQTVSKILPFTITE